MSSRSRSRVAPKIGQHGRPASVDRRDNISLIVRPRITMGCAPGLESASRAPSWPTRTSRPRCEAPTSKLPFTIKPIPPNILTSRTSPGDDRADAGGQVLNTRAFLGSLDESALKSRADSTMADGRFAHFQTCSSSRSRVRPNRHDYGIPTCPSRGYFWAHSLESLKRNILAACGLKPAHAP